MQSIRTFEWITRRLPSARPLRVLDVGCGECPEGETLLVAGVSFTGLDLDEGAVSLACGRLPGATFICGDAASFKPEPATPFDVVFLRRPDLAAQPGRWRIALASMPAWLTPNGRVLLTTPGPGEARLGQRWLAEAGFAETTLEQSDEEGEGYVVTAMRPKAMSVHEGKPMLEDVIVWQDDGSEPAPFCDPRTGMCGGLPVSNEFSKEKDNVDKS